MQCGVVTNPDRQKNRGMKLQESDVKTFAREKGLTIYQPEKIRGNTEFEEEIKKINPDIICVIAYRKNLAKRNIRSAKTSDA